jgi:methionyl-tRNA formyltransferase
MVKDGARIAFMGNPGYGGWILGALLENGANVVAVFRQSTSKKHRVKKVYRRYFRSFKRMREGVRRVGEKLGSMRDEAFLVPGFGKDVVDVALPEGVSVFDGSFVHDPDCPEVLKSLGVDVLLVATFGEMLPAAVLAAPSTASINIHPSLLPKYRGGFPEFSAVLDGERKSGISFHLMEEKFDAGNILLQKEILLNDGETTISLKARLATLASSSVPEFLDLIAAGDLAGDSQDASAITYCKLEKQFDRIDKTMTKRRIENIVNACFDNEDIGRPYFDYRGTRVFVLSCGNEGFPFDASDGCVYFDALRFRHKIYRGAACAELYESF